MKTVSRRSTIAAVLGSAVAFIFGGTKASNAANAADGDPLILGIINEAASPTVLRGELQVEEGLRALGATNVIDNTLEYGNCGIATVSHAQEAVCGFALTNRSVVVASLYDFQPRLWLLAATPVVPGTEIIFRLSRKPDRPVRIGVIVIDVLQSGTISPCS